MGTMEEPALALALALLAAMDPTTTPVSSLSSTAVHNRVNLVGPVLYPITPMYSVTRRPPETRQGQRQRVVLNLHRCHGVRGVPHRVNPAQQGDFQ